MTDSTVGALSENLVTRAGFNQAVKLVGRLRNGGLLWLAPECSTWVFYNVSRTKRCKNNHYEGDLDYPPVQGGNAMAEACVFLIKIARARGVNFAVENPERSYIWHCKFFQAWLSWEGLHHTSIHRCAYDTAPFGQRIMKVYKVVGSGQWLQNLVAPCPCGDAPHKRLTRSWLNSEGRHRVQGVADLLKESQAYPPAFGVQVVKCWQANMKQQTQSPHVQNAALQIQRISWAAPSNVKVAPKRSLAKPTWAQPDATTGKWLGTSLGKKARCHGPHWSQPCVNSK